MSRTPSVLAVDDERIVLLDLQSSIRSEGYEALTAADGSTTLQLAHERQPDIMLIDLYLGDENGVELMSRLREVCPDSIYVVMSVHADITAAIDAMHAGAHDFLVKPFSREDLSLLLRRAVDRLKLSRTKAQAEQALRDRNSELLRVNERLRRIVRAVTAPELLGGEELAVERLFHMLADAMGARGGSLYLMKDGRLELRHTLDPDHSPATIALPPAEGTVLARVLETRRPVVTDDIAHADTLAESGWPGYSDGSLMSFPLLSPSGGLEGVLNLHNPLDRPFLSQDVDLGVICSSLLVEAIQLGRVYDELQARGRWFRALIENSTDLITLVDADLRITYESPSVETLLGYTPESRLGQRFDGFVHPDDRELCDRSLARVAVPGARSEPVTVRVRHRNGAWRFLEIGMSNRLGDPTVAGIILNARDQTEQREAARKLRKSEQRYRELFDYSPAVIFVTGTDQRFLEVNNAAVKTLGYAADELIGRPVRELMTKASAEQLREMWPLIERGETLPALEYEFVAKDGSVRHFYVRAGARHRLFDGPTMVGIMSQFMDVTELHAARAREEAQREELYQASKLASLGTLLSGVAHEINNPNNFIRMSVDNLRDFWRDAEHRLDALSKGGESFSLGGIPYARSREMVRKTIASIHGGSERIERLVTDLKEFARPAESTEIEVVDLREVLDSAITIVGATIRKATSVFQVDAPIEPLPVPCRTQQIEQVMMNLISNACHALTDPQQAIIVRLRRAAGGDRVHFSVEDEGRGMPQEMLPSITDPFFTTRRGEGGTGLGLAVVHRIVSEHGGTVEFASVQDEGTTATVSLPLSGEPLRSGHVASEEGE